MRFCTLVSGSSGNSTLVAAGGTRILVDSGRSGKHIAACLANAGTGPAEIDYILVTHEHSDHTASVGILSRRFDIPVYATAGTWEGMSGSDGIGAIRECNKCLVEEDIPFVLGDIEATAFTIPHDANQPVGYRFESTRATAVVATDIGFLSDTVKENVTGADIVLLEANYDVERLKSGSYPYYLKKRILGDQGHLSNHEAAHFAVNLARTGTQYIVLGHLSQENNTPQIALAEVSGRMQEKGVDLNRDVQLSVASRHENGPIIAI